MLTNLLNSIPIFNKKTLYNYFSFDKAPLYIQTNFYLDKLKSKVMCNTKTVQLKTSIFTIFLF